MGLGIAQLSALRLLLRPDTDEQLPTTCDVMLLCHDNDRALNLGGRAYSQVLDTAGDKLAARGYVVTSVAARLSALTGSRAHRNAVAINRGVFIAMVRDRLAERMRGDRSQRHSTRFWVGLLTRHRPRVIVGIGLSPALCRAATQLGITTIEAIHGFGLPRDDWAHGAEARTLRKNEDEPDLLVAYDQVTLETAQLGNRGKKTTAMLARPPFLEMQSRPEDLPTFLAALHPTRRESGNYERVALLTLQHGYDGGRDFLANIIPNGILHPDIEEVIRRDAKIFWLIKLHPVQLRGHARERLSKFMRSLSHRYANIEWERSSTAAMAHLLQVADVHITMSSGTVYEAAMSGVPSAAFCPTVRTGGYLQTYFEDLVRSGCVTKSATDADSLHRWIGAAAGQRSTGSAFAGFAQLPTTADIVELALERKPSAPPTR